MAIQKITADVISSDAITTNSISDSAITAAKLAGTLDLTGKTITGATASSGDNDTSIASTAFVQQELASLVDSAPGTLNTLNELAAALGDDANFSTTVTNSIATKLPLAGGTLTGALTVTGDANPALEISRGSANTTNVNLKYNTTLTGQLSAANEKFQISAAGSGTEMEFYVNGAKRLEIDTTGKLQLGTTSSSQTIFQFLSATNGANTIHFGDGASADAYRGYINYNHTGDRMEFATSGTERMRIDGSGRVGIAQDTPGDFNSGADDLVIGNSGGDFGITIRTGTSNTGNIVFADGVSGNQQYRG